MFQVELEVPEETVVKGYSKIISFKSEQINDADVAWAVFYKAKDTVDSLVNGGKTNERYANFSS